MHTRGVVRAHTALTVRTDNSSLFSALVSLLHVSHPQPLVTQEQLGETQHERSTVNGFAAHLAEALSAQDGNHSRLQGSTAGCCLMRLTLRFKSRVVTVVDSQVLTISGWTRGGSVGLAPDAS